MSVSRIGFVRTLAVLVLTLSATSVAQVSEVCKPINGRLMTIAVDPSVFWCTSPIGFCAEGLILGDGLIQGTTQAVVLGLFPSVGSPGLERETTLSFVGDRLIQTKHGDLNLRFTGVFDSARGEFAELQRVLSGTGTFEGATGTLYLTGTSNSTGTEFVADVTGTICHAPGSAT